MKNIDATLSIVIGASVAVFLAYIGLHYWNVGIFLTLPAEMTDFFLRNGYLQHIALGLLIIAMIARYSAGRALRSRQRPDSAAA